MNVFLKMGELGLLVVVFVFEMGLCLGGQQSSEDIMQLHFTNSDFHPNVEEVKDNFYNSGQRTRHNEISGSERNSRFITDRKDTLNFPNIENLFSSSNFEVVEPDYENFDGTYESSDEYYSDGTKYDNKNPERNKYLFPKDASKTHKEGNDETAFQQSQQVVPDSENFGSFYISSNFEPDIDEEKRPNFWTKTRNFYLPQSSELVHKSYSYIQKIPLIKHEASTSTSSPTIMESDSNKYEEVDLIHGESPKSTRKMINAMMKKYLANLIVEKYGLNRESLKNKTTTHHTMKTDSKYSSYQNISRDPKIEKESKFLYGNSLWKLKNKLKQFFSLFTVIKFNNTACNATNWAGTWQGICLTSSECTQSNGTALGNCASGYGVCCVFRGSCGDSSSTNCSYFKSPNYPDFYPSNGGVITPTTTSAPGTAPTPDPRLYWYYYNKGWGDADLDNIISSRQSTSDTLSCVFSVYKTNSNVQQFRIDFIDLDLASPTNGTCTNERLVITGSNANDQIPVICGYNTGQHAVLAFFKQKDAQYNNKIAKFKETLVYIDVSQFNGPLQIMVLSATGARKRFKLRICQYTDSCSSSQSNCLQYYIGVSGVIQSFNYDQAAMFNRSVPGYFNNLNYAICIRREAGYCSITYMNVANGQTYPFQFVNVLPNGQLTVPSGQAGVDVLNCPDDYIIIDGTRLCGDRFNDGSTTTNFTINAPVVDTSSGPIVINVRTNNNVTGLGFKLYYTQNACSTM